MDAEQAEVAWYGKQGKLLAHAITVATLLKLAADECRELFDSDDSFGPEINVLADALNFGTAAAGNIVDVISDRVKARKEELHDGRMEP